MNSNSNKISHRNEDTDNSFIGNLKSRLKEPTTKFLIGPCMISFGIPLIVPGFVLTFVAYNDETGFNKYSALHIVGFVCLVISVILIILGCVCNCVLKPRSTTENDVELVGSSFFDKQRDFSYITGHSGRSPSTDSSKRIHVRNDSKVYPSSSKTLSNSASNHLSTFDSKSTTTLLVDNENSKSPTVTSHTNEAMAPGHTIGGKGKYIPDGKDSDTTYDSTTISMESTSKSHTDNGTLTDSTSGLGMYDNEAFDDDNFNYR